MSKFRDGAQGQEKEVDPTILYNAAERMGNKRARLLLQQPFYGVLLSMVDFIPEASIPTMATDGAKVYYNPEFVMEITDDEVFGVILHEISHCIYLHCTQKRRMNRAHTRWNYACFPGDTLIPGTFKRMDEIREGEYVFGLNGQRQVITNTMSKPYFGNMHTIQATGVLPIKCTEEHPIYVATKDKGYPIKLSDPVWKKARDVNVKDDYLVIPVAKGNIEIDKINLSSYLNMDKTNNHDQCHNVAQCVKDGITLDETFAWIMGIYTAEGSKTNSAGHGIQFSLHKDEKEYANRIVKFGEDHGYKPYIKQSTGNSVGVVINSSLLSRFFEENIGRGAHNKRIPDFILFNKDTDILKAYLNGLFDGDGCHVQDNTDQLATVSLTLALQTQMAIARLGHFAQVRKNTMKEREIRGKVLSQSDIYVVDWRQPKITTRNLNGKVINSTSKRWHMIGNNIFVPITENNVEEYSGIVYNLTTEDHTYTVSNALVHNCDYAINLEIKDMGYALPGKVLLDQQFRDMNAEQIYDKLPDDEKELAKLGLPFDIHINNADESSWDDMEDKIITAYEMTKNQKGKGNMPGGLKRWIDKLRKSKVKWERVFHRYIGQALSKDDYSYTRVNKRFLGQDIYLPDLRNHIIGSVVIAVDTSGSIGRNCLEQFAAEISKISYLVDEITAMSCDARVHEVVKVRKFENFLNKLQFKGGGGTAFEPVFDKVKEMKLQPELLIYLTDAYGSYPEKQPAYPVLWCVTCEDGMSWIPWGQKVLLPNEKGDW